MTTDTQRPPIPLAEIKGPDKGGVWVVMGDKQYKVAPLNFKAMRELSAKISSITSLEKGEMPSGEQMSALVPIAHAALKRNYPQMTEDEVADNLDFGNFGNVLSAVLGTSGLNKDKGENSSGEAQTTH
jgi:hypothetical protein